MLEEVKLEDQQEGHLWYDNATDDEGPLPRVQGLVQVRPVGCHKEHAARQSGVHDEDPLNPRDWDYSTEGAW